MAAALVRSARVDCARELREERSNDRVTARFAPRRLFEPTLRSSPEQLPGSEMAPIQLQPAAESSTGRRNGRGALLCARVRIASPSDSPQRLESAGAAELDQARPERLCRRLSDAVEQLRVGAADHRARHRGRRGRTGGRRPRGARGRGPLARARELHRSGRAVLPDRDRGVPRAHHLDPAQLARVALARHAQDAHPVTRSPAQPRHDLGHRVRRRHRRRI